MKNLMTAIVACVLLAGCSSTPKQPETAAAPAATHERQLITTTLPLGGGNAAMQIEFDEAGQWSKLATQGTAELEENASPSATESAYMIATLRAKRVLAEFMSTDLRTSRTLNRIEKSIIKANPAAPARATDDMDLNVDPQEKARAEKLTTLLTERITEQSSAILRGTYVARRYQNGTTVVVDIAASRQSVEAARNIAKQMSSSL